MQWTKKDTITLVFAVVIIAATIVILIIRSPINRAVEPTLILDAEEYDIVGDIIVGGMFVSWDVVNDILKKRNANVEELYKYFLINGRLPDEFDQEIRQVINPSFLELNNADKMCVKFDVALGDTTGKVRVNTRNYSATLVYYLAVEHGRRVMFRQGEPPAPVSGVASTDTFPSHEAYVIGDNVVGTPYNFVPLFPGETDAMPHK